MRTQALTKQMYTANLDRDRDFHFRVKDPGSAATHFIGFLAAVLLTPVLLVHASDCDADLMTMIGMSVFMLSMILLYGASTSYHSFDISEGESAFEENGSYDDFCIDCRFLYTGLSDCIKRQRWYEIAGCCMGLAIVGMIFKLLWVTCPKWVSSVIYIAMGWVCVLAMPQLVAGLSFGAFMWLLAGGLFIQWAA